MIVCVDLDGTISGAPDFYAAEMRGLLGAGHEVHVLTGDPQPERVLGRLGLQRGRHYTCAAVVPRRGIAAFKVAYMREVGATHLVDNRKANIRAARQAGFTGHWHAQPKEKP